MRTEMRIARAWARTLVVAAGLVTAHNALAADTVTLGLVTRHALSWPVFAAMDKGFFDKLGIKVDIVTTGGSAQGTLQLAANSIHVASVGLPDLLRAMDQGAPLKIIGYECAESPYKLMAGKNIQSIAALKGKNIIIGGSKDITGIYLDAMVNPAGFKRSDVNLLYAGASSARLSALISGGADAAILTSPFDFQAISMGYTDLGDIPKALPGFPISVYAVNTSWGNPNRATVVNFLKGFHQGVRWLYDSANKAEAVGILVKATGGKPDDIAKIYDLFMRDLKAYGKEEGIIPPEGFNRILNLLAENGDLPKPVAPMSKFVDDSFLKAAFAR